MGKSLLGKGRSRTGRGEEVVVRKDWASVVYVLAKKGLEKKAI